MALSVKPGNILAYFANTVCPFRANYLDSRSICAFHTSFYEEYKSHHKGYECYCFSGRIFKLLLEVIIARRKDSNFLSRPEFDAKISFARTKRQKPDTFNLISQRINADSYFVYSILSVDGTCKKPTISLLVKRLDEFSEHFY